MFSPRPSRGVELTSHALWQACPDYGRIRRAVLLLASPERDLAVTGNYIWKDARRTQKMVGQKFLDETHAVLTRVSALGRFRGNRVWTDHRSNLPEVA